MIIVNNVYGMAIFLSNTRLLIIYYTNNPLHDAIKKIELDNTVLLFFLSSKSKSGK